MIIYRTSVSQPCKRTQFFLQYWCGLVSATMQDSNTTNLQYCCSLHWDTKLTWRQSWSVYCTTTAESHDSLKSQDKLWLLSPLSIFLF